MKKGYYLKLSIAFVVFAAVNFLLSPKQDGIPALSIFLMAAAVAAYFIHRKKG